MSTSTETPRRIEQINVDEAEIRYTIATPEQLGLLQPLFTSLGWEMPDPDYSKILIASFGEGTNAIVLGFNVVQFIPHAEPMWVSPHARGTVVAEGLARAAQHYLEVDSGQKRYLVVCRPGSHAARIAESLGYVPHNGQVYVRQVSDEPIN